MHLQSTLGLGPEGLLSLHNESHLCDVDTHSLPFQFCHLLLLAFSISRCWRRGPTVRAVGTWKGFDEALIYPRRALRYQSGVKLSRVHPFQRKCTYHMSLSVLLELMRKRNNSLLLASLPRPPT